MCGHDQKQEPRAALAAMGVVFQRPTLDLDLTVDQNLRYAASLCTDGAPEPGSARCWSGSTWATGPAARCAR